MGALIERIIRQEGSLSLLYVAHLVVALLVVLALMPLIHR